MLPSFVAGSLNSLIHRYWLCKYSIFLCVVGKFTWHNKKRAVESVTGDRSLTTFLVIIIKKISCAGAYRLLGPIHTYPFSFQKEFFSLRFKKIHVHM